MPTMANITVKNAANADVVYNAAVPSAGDRSAARWNANALSTIAGFRPTITVVTRDNSDGSGRIMEVNGAFPHTATVSGVVQKVAQTTVKAQFSLPRTVDTTVVLDAYTQMTNLMAAALFRGTADEGYAPT